MPALSNTVCQNALQLMTIVTFTTAFSILVLKNSHPSEVVNIILHVLKDAAFILSNSIVKRCSCC